MHVVLLIINVCLAAIVHSSHVEEKVVEYFKSDVHQALQKQWRTFKAPFEQAIRSSLEESYGGPMMNVYVRRSSDAQRLSGGFYGADNFVDWLLMDLTISDFPNFITPKVTFALASNYLRVRAGLGDMTLQTKFTLFRNQTYIDTKKELLNNQSILSFINVEHFGTMAIVAEHCVIDGFVLTKLSGTRINLGHDTFRVQNCSFTLEISSKRRMPVIGQYFSAEQSQQLEKLLTKPIRGDMMPKLQAAVFSYMNTSLIFGDHLPKFRDYQNNMFKETAKYVKDITAALDSKTVEASLATMDVEPLKAIWKSTFPLTEGRIEVENVTVHGLDTLYSSHSGGPCKLLSTKIVESLRFNSLMVRGSVSFKNKSNEENCDFVTEIHDVAVNFEIDLEKPEAKFDFVNWRSFALSILEVEEHNREFVRALVYGYLVNKLPILLTTHLSDMYKQLNTAQPLMEHKPADCNCENKNKNKS